MHMQWSRGFCTWYLLYLSNNLEGGVMETKEMGPIGTQGLRLGLGRGLKIMFGFG